MTERIQIGNKWYVAATAARTDQNLQTLKEGETFALFDRFGDIQNFGNDEQGVYHEDTRFLSHQELLLDGMRPLYLGSNIRSANSLLTIDLMNPDIEVDDRVVVAKGTIHIFRAKLLWRGACYEHVRVVNHGLDKVKHSLSWSFDADFVDLFEVRGMHRERRGERGAPEVGEDEVVVPYLGLDSVRRRTRMRFTPRPSQVATHQARYDFALAPNEELHLYCTVSCESGDAVAPARDYRDALREADAARAAGRQARCTLETSNPLVNQWISRSESDIAMVTTELPTGPYPYAGVPWYSTTFGRDGILTAREMLWVDPAMARGVLRFLAASQAGEDDASRDAEPGKILHEARRSEMANTREIPFGRYYGTVDATPLFVSLAGAYWRRTGDMAFVREIWPHVLRALKWIDTHGDVDGDGFVEYRRKSAEGLVQQGWKDSHDSIFHADGRMADAPIALVEVQAYVYEAKLLAADVAQAMDDPALASRLRDEAAALRDNFDRAFWCAELGSYALALDGAKKPCQVLSSNAGHALWTGIALPQRAHALATRFLDPTFFNGWGIRTIAEGQARYNPMSYHNGSVWPHDTALVAAGMARYGHTDAALQVMSGLFDSSLYFEQSRLPELFCGFARRDDEGPVLYPVACSPQAWAAAAVYSLLQSCLGMDVDAVRSVVTLRAPRLPHFIDRLHIRRLPVGPNGMVELLVQRYEHNVGVEIVRKEGGVEVVVAI